MPTSPIERSATREPTRHKAPDRRKKLRRLEQLEKDKGIDFRSFVLDVANPKSYTQGDIAAWWGVTEHTIGKWLDIHGFVQYVVYKEEHPNRRELRDAA